MCGIIGLLLGNEDEHVNQMLFDGLTVLQHRGQDAAGMVTAESAGRRLHLRKDNGLVRDVFQQHHMQELRGCMGIAHCRYPTAGSSSCAEAQPLYTNYPFGICVAHNGNLTNTVELASHLRDTVGRHVNTDSDSELLLNLFAENLTRETRERQQQQQGQGLQQGADNNGNSNKNSSFYDRDPVDLRNAVFAAITAVMKQCKGGYAGMYLINGIGLVGFRDPHGIRPIVFGCRKSGSSRRYSKDGSNKEDEEDSDDDDEDDFDEDGIPRTPGGMGKAERKLDYVISSESVAIDTLGFTLIRDIKAGEAIFIDTAGNCHTRQCSSGGQEKSSNDAVTKADKKSSAAAASPCIFEYVYFARPDSIMDGVSVYETRLRMGEKLADKILRAHPDHGIDVVIPIPDTSRTAALQAAYRLNRPFREGFIKNRYIARTFIMPGQATRKKSVRLKLNTIKSEFAGKRVLLVDDSIVRGTTAHEIVQMAREAGAKKVFFSSAAPPIRFPNIYGIDIPTRRELIAYGRDEAEIAAKIGCDWVTYQDLRDLEDSIRETGQRAGKKKTMFAAFDTSCFSGIYVTGEKITDSYFERLHDLRNDAAKSMKRERSFHDGHGNSRYLERQQQDKGDGGDAANAVDPSTSSEPASKKRAVAAAAADESGAGDLPCENLSNDRRSSNLSNGNNGGNGGGGGGSDACEPIMNNPTAGMVR